MAILTWDQTGVRYFETGVDKGVFYPRTGSGVAWNGLVAVTETISGGEVDSFYLEGQKTIDVVANEDYQAQIDAFSAPVEFLACDGTKSLALGLYVTQQPRTMFGFSYRTYRGNDVKATEFGYKIHLVYNAKASPTSRPNRSVADSAEPMILSWKIDTIPVASTTYKSAAHLVIDSTLATPSKLTTLENLLYGTASVNGILPPQSIVYSTLA